MNQQPAEIKQFVAVMVRQYTIASVSFMTDGWGNPGPPNVTVELRRSELVVAEMPGQITSDWIGDGRSLRYSEIKNAESVVNSKSYLVRGVSPREIPFGVRLQLGESRSHMLLFTTEHEALMDGLESHHVPVDRAPRKLGFLLMGRK
jgi:hypothetical protein